MKDECGTDSDVIETDALELAAFLLASLESIYGFELMLVKSGDHAVIELLEDDESIIEVNAPAECATRLYMLLKAAEEHLGDD